MLIAGLSEASVTQIVVAFTVFLGVLVTATGAVIAAFFTRSTNREVKYRNGGGIDGTLAERLDARFERIETRFDRLEEKHLHVEKQLDGLDELVASNVARIERTEKQMREMRRRAFAFFDRFVLRERDEEQRRIDRRGADES